MKNEPLNTPGKKVEWAGIKTYPKYVWAVVPIGNFSGCLEIRRYAFSHEHAVSQLAHNGHRRSGYKDVDGHGVWTLFKLTRVNKRHIPKPRRRK